MTHNLDPQIFKVVGVEPPSKSMDLICVMITLKNMLGEQKQERIMFNDVFQAYEFYRTQKNMLVKQKNDKVINR